MKTKKFVAILILGATCFLISCTSFQRATDEGSLPPGWRADTESTDLVYEPLGIHFPAKIRDWVRVDPITYDSEGLDVSVGYNATEAPLIVDLYIYLRSYYHPSDLEGHFQYCIEEIKRDKPGSRVISQEPTDFPIGSAEVSGLKAFVRQRKGNDELGSYAVLLPYGERFVYLRVTFAGGDQDHVVQGVWEIMKVFMKGINFPLEPLSK
jgi:hypothetical protein